MKTETKPLSTPVVDFVKAYAESDTIRLHMPGHKGQHFLGCESWDITEIGGADSLYEAEGIIAESEDNATTLFGSQCTLFSIFCYLGCAIFFLYIVGSCSSAGSSVRLKI